MSLVFLNKATASKDNFSLNKSICDLMSVLPLIAFNCSSLLSSIFFSLCKSPSF